MADKVGAVIVAAGKGERMRGVDKIFAPVAGKPLLAWAIEAFQRCPEVHEVVVVLSAKNLDRGTRLVAERNYSKVVSLCLGGLRRQDSVAQGLGKLTKCQWVIIHDGARPCVTRTMIERGLMKARDTGAAIAAVPVKDTIKWVGADMAIQETPDRGSLWMAQTPQVFRQELLYKAYRDARADFTDDAALLEALGQKVKVYMGSYENIKVTTPSDLAIAELILKQGLSGEAKQ